MTRSDKTGDDTIREASRTLFTWTLIAAAWIAAIVVGFMLVGYHFTASLGALEIERACVVRISWWKHLLWMVAPFGTPVLFFALRGFVIRSTLAAALISAAVFGAVLYMDFLLVGVPGTPGQYDTDRSGYCNLMRSLLPAR